MHKPTDAAPGTGLSKASIHKWAGNDGPSVEVGSTVCGVGRQPGQQKHDACCPAGVAPTAAMRLLQQLQLFSVVFAPPPHLVKVVGTSFGAQCVEVMAAAEKLLGALDLQVSRTAHHNTHHHSHPRPHHDVGYRSVTSGQSVLTAGINLQHGVQACNTVGCQY